MSDASKSASWPPPEDEDWPGTWDLVLGKDGWRLESHTCENRTCWCWQDRDPIEKRCGYTPKRAQAERITMLRWSDNHAEIARIVALSIDEFMAEHGIDPDEGRGMSAVPSAPPALGRV